MQTYCFFSAQYLPTSGGVERYTFNMAKELIRRGNSVIVVTSILPGMPEFEVDQHGIKIFRIPACILLNGRMPVSYPLLKWKIVCSQLNTLKITRIVIQTRLYTLSLMGMHYAKSHDIPFITIEHGTSYVGMKNPILRFLEKSYEDILMSFAKKWCKAFFCVSQAGTEWLKHFDIVTCGVLYNSVDDLAIQNYLADETDDIRKKFALNEDAKIVAFVGRLIPEKGIKQLVEAIHEINPSSSLYLFIAGDGPLYKELKQMNYSNIYLLGNLPQAEIMTLLHQSNMFCLPSDSEGFPTSVLEAVLCHCYVITTPFGGAKELICSAKYGKIINNNSKQEIKDSILCAISSLESCKASADNAFKRFYLYFTWEKTCDAIEDIPWEDIL